MLVDLLPTEKAGAIIELKVYLMDSFGSYERIDYGTGFLFYETLSNIIGLGHELSFILFLLCLKELEFYDKTDYETLLRNVFYR